MVESKKQIFLWFGDNDFEISHQTNYWVEAFTKKYSGLNISKFDYSENKSNKNFTVDVKNALQVDSLFGANKFIILKNFLAEKLNAELEEVILRSLEKISESFFVVFQESKAPKKVLKTYKALAKLGKSGQAEIKEFNLPQGQALVRWILNKAKQNKVTFSPEVVNLLTAMVGNDLWQLDIEINKLANYRKDQKVTTEDVNLLVKGKYNDDVFQLMDAISDKDKKKILKLVKDQLDSGASDMYLLSMLIRQFRIFLQVKELMEQGQNNQMTMAKELSLHPYVVKKTMYYLRHFTFTELKKIYKKLLEFEINMKTKNINFELLFDLLVAEL